MSFEGLMVEAQVELVERPSRAARHQQHLGLAAAHEAERLRPLQRPAANRRGRPAAEHGADAVELLAASAELPLAGADLGGAVEGVGDGLVGLVEFLGGLFG